MSLISINFITIHTRICLATYVSHFTCCKSVQKSVETIPAWWNYDAAQPLGVPLALEEVWRRVARSGRWGPGSSAS